MTIYLDPEWLKILFWVVFGIGIGMVGMMCWVAGWFKY